MSRDSFTMISLPFAVIVFLVLVGIVIALAANSVPVLLNEGLDFVLSSRWSPKFEFYGILPALLGTLYVSAIATLLVALLSLGVVALEAEYTPGRMRKFVQSLMFYAAALPTVIFGLWGLDYVAPLLRDLRLPLICRMSSVTGQSVLAGAIVLAMMNTPYASLILSEAYRSIPFTYREVLYSMGATGYERFSINLGMIKDALVGALFLTFGKSVGETTAVSMVVGNSFNIPLCPLEPGTTISSLIVNYVSEAMLYNYMLSALYGAALVMLLLNTIFVVAGLWIVRRASSR